MVTRFIPGHEVMLGDDVIQDQVVIVHQVNYGREVMQGHEVIEGHEAIQGQEVIKITWWFRDTRSFRTPQGHSGGKAVIQYTVTKNPCPVGPGSRCPSGGQEVIHGYEKFMSRTHSWS
jgi:hypothetical protein